jgi:CRP/FNR family transcriptional regulator, cyclic AMP receptor protein
MGAFSCCKDNNLIMLATAPSKLENTLAAYPTQTIKKNLIIVHPDTQIDRLYYLRKGKVKQSIFTQEGKEAILHVFEPCAIFPLAIGLANTKNKYTFESLTHLEVKIIPLVEFVNIMKKNPEISLDLLQSFSKGLIGLSQRIELLTTTNAHERLLSLITHVGQKRGRIKGKKILIGNPPSHSEMATWIGSTRETVSREIKILRNEKLLSYPNRKMLIINLAHLESKTRGK